MKVVVTGAASGIGKALCETLADWNGDVPSLYERIDVTGLDVSHMSRDRRYEVLTCDITDDQQVEHVLAHREVDALINCAGVTYLDQLETLRMVEAQHVMDVNLWGAVRCIRACLPSLKAKQGVVCNITSTAAHRAMRYSLAYNASKAAAEMMTKQLARELIDQDVVVFGVSPNKVRGTGMSAQADREAAALRGTVAGLEAAEQRATQLLAREEPTASEVAAFVARLVVFYSVQLAGCIYQYGGDR